MPAIPTTISLNKSTMNKDQFHTWMLDLHAYLTGVIASTGTAEDARAQIGLGTAATKNTGVATGEVPLVGTKSATELLAGTVELATSAEAQALSDAFKALTPYTLAQALKGANQSLAENGYQKLPGGLIIQWVKSAGSSTEGPGSVTLPIAFPNGCLHAMAGSEYPTNNGANTSWIDVTSLSTTSIGFFFQSSAASWSGLTYARILAIGH